MTRRTTPSPPSEKTAANPFYKWANTQLRENPPGRKACDLWPHRFACSPDKRLRNDPTKSNMNPPSAGPGIMTSERL
jgi:hypothetical protein